MRVMGPAIAGAGRVLGVDARAAKLSAQAPEDVVRAVTEQVRTALARPKPGVFDFVLGGGVKERPLWIATLRTALNDAGWEFHGRGPTIVRADTDGTELAWTTVRAGPLSARRLAQRA